MTSGSMSGNRERYDGLLTDEVLSRALAELEGVHAELVTPGDERGHAWLIESERRIDNAMEDVTFVRDAFRKAQR